VVRERAMPGPRGRPKVQHTRTTGLARTTGTTIAPAAPSMLHAASKAPLLLPTTALQVNQQCARPRHLQPGAAAAASTDPRPQALSYRTDARAAIVLVALAGPAVPCMGLGTGFPAGRARFGATACQKLPATYIHHTHCRLRSHTKERKETPSTIAACSSRASARHS
jgi:hypothetical protein